MEIELKDLLSLMTDAVDAGVQKYVRSCDPQADYVKQGYAVVCYDQEPSGRSKLAKVYGDHERHCNDYVKKSIRIFKYNNGDYGPVRK